MCRALKIAHSALRLEREKENFRCWLATDRCFAIEYEQLSGKPHVRDTVMNEICTFLDLPARESFPSDYIKVTPPLRDVLLNYNELVRVARLFGGGRLWTA